MYSMWCLLARKLEGDQVCEVRAENFCVNHGGRFKLIFLVLVLGLDLRFSIALLASVENSFVKHFDSSLDSPTYPYPRTWS